jgi:glycosyltransferase involved in cell wall biosynthesis
MRVMFDHQIFAEQRHGGISRYFVELARSLIKLPACDPFVVAPMHINEYLKSANLPGFQCQSSLTMRGSARLHDAANRAMTPLMLGWFNPDIVHATYFRPSTSRTKRPLVLTVYDMIHEKYASAFPASDNTARLKRISIDAADHIVCISRQTQRDLIDILGVPESKTSVTHLAHSIITDPEWRGSIDLCDMPSLLYVGQRRAYKNFQNFARAFAASERLKRAFKITCFGGDAFTNAERTMFRDLGIPEDRIERLTGTDKELQQAYQRAAVFVYPSLYEGFGIPPLEAMACGCPVVCSNTSSIPEVVGEGADTFDPTSIESIRDALEGVCFNDVHRRDLIARGSMRQSLFSWDRCARETLNIYRSI